MKEIHMGDIIAKKRREKGITQEGLAQYVGVTKTAVSKWETNQSYPDISFLPVLASYFNMSIDALIGYEPLMSEEEITLFYKRMCVAFTKEPIEDVLQELELQAKKYHACSTLLLYIALLYYNHLNLMEAERIPYYVEKAKVLLQHVRKQSEDLWQKRTALELEALADLTLQKPKEALRLLGPLESINSNQLRAKAYYMDEQIDKAIETLQADVLQALLIIYSSSEMLMGLYATQSEKLDELTKRIQILTDTFDMTSLNPGTMLSLYANAFTAYGTAKDAEHTYIHLEKFIDTLTHIKQFQPVFGTFFDHITEKTLLSSALPLELAREEEVIRKSCFQAVIENPSLTWLTHQERFQKLVKKLETYTIYYDTVTQQPNTIRRKETTK